MSSGMIYWITRLDGINSAVNIFAWVLLLGTITTYIVRAVKEEDWSLKKLTSITVLVCATTCFVPTTKEMAMIYVVPNLVNSELAQEIPEDMKVIKDMAVEKIKDMLEKEVV